jgi:hypothetical protein
MTHDGNIIAASIPFIELIKEMKVQSGNCKLPKRTLIISTTTTI